MTASLPQTFPASSDWASAYVGLPFRWHGYDREGVSCWGLVRLVQEEVFGRVLPKHSECETAAKIGADVGLKYLDHGFAKPIGAEVEGDVLHMWGLHLGRRTPTHCGVVVKPGWVLHAEEGPGSVVTPYRGNRFLNRVIGVYGLV